MTGLLAPAAAAQEDLSIDGSVSGSVARGDRLTLRISALEAGGWSNLDELRAELVIGGDVADRVVFDIGDNLLTVGEQTVALGTGETGDGAYLSVSGPEVIVTTGGARLEFTARMRLLQSIPSDAAFRLQAVDDFGASAAITRRVRAPASDDTGFTWATVITAVAVALFAGGFIGSVFASRRRPPAGPSIYATVQRRLDEERAPKGSDGATEAPKPAS